MTITHDQEKDKNPIEEAVKKQNEDLLTFFTQTTSESYTGDSDVYGEEEVHGFKTQPVNSKEFKEKYRDNIKKGEFYSMLPNPDLLDSIAKNIKSEEGKKISNNKVDYGELDWDYIDEMALRMSKNTDYPPENWKKPMDIKELAKASIRHARKILQGVEEDKETFEDHAKALGCNGMMIHYQLKHNK